jgi:DNA polymerase III epsilon subunit-like protein
VAIPKELMGDVLVFDTETAHDFKLAHQGKYACEIGFSLFRSGRPLQEHGTFVKPPIPIDPEASSVHNIYDRDVENAPSFKHIAWWFWNILNSVDVHVAYNYEFDRLVLEDEFKRLGMTFPLKPMIDPFIFFKQYHKYHKGKKLIDAAGEYGIPFIGAHRAVNDATVTGKLLFRMAAVKTTFPKTLKSLIPKQRQMVEAQFVDLANYFKKVGRSDPTPPDYRCYEL